MLLGERGGWCLILDFVALVMIYISPAALLPYFSILPPFLLSTSFSASIYFFSFLILSPSLSHFLPPLTPILPLPPSHRIPFPHLPLPFIIPARIPTPYPSPSPSPFPPPPPFPSVAPLSPSPFPPPPHFHAHLRPFPPSPPHPPLFLLEAIVELKESG